MLPKARWKDAHLTKAYARKLAHQLFLIEELLILFHPPHLPQPYNPFPTFLWFLFSLLSSFHNTFVWGLDRRSTPTSLSSTQVRRPSSAISGHFSTHWRSPLQHTCATRYRGHMRRLCPFCSLLVNPMVLTTFSFGSLPLWLYVEFLSCK